MNQLKCGQLLADHLENEVKESYHEAVRCFGEIFAKKRLKIYDTCMNNRKSPESCHLKFKRMGIMHYILAF